MGFKVIDGEPPNQPRKLGAVGEVLAELKAKFPGKWAELEREYVSQSSSRHAALYLSERYNSEGFVFLKKGKKVFAKFVGVAEKKSKK